MDPGMGRFRQGSLLDEWRRITDREEESVDFFFSPPVSLSLSPFLIVGVCVNVSVYLRIFAYWSAVVVFPLNSEPIGTSFSLALSLFFAAAFSVVTFLSCLLRR